MRRFLIYGPIWGVLATLMAAAYAGKAQTWIQWSSAAGGNDHYYALTPMATNWVAAQKLAISWGGTLATISSSNEQGFINRTFLTGEFEHLPLWIGLARSRGKAASGSLGLLHVQIGLKPKTEFHWATGEALSYTNWKPGEPSDTSPGEDYVAINWAYSDVPPRGNKGDWNDTPLNGTSGYGGKTDGPYFGLVERETNPNVPVRRVFQRNAVYISLLAALAVVTVICVARLRKHI